MAGNQLKTRITKVVGALLLIPMAVIGFNTASSSSRQISPAPAPVELDMAPLPDILSAAVRIPTVSSAPPSSEKKQTFDALKTLLETRFPLTHQTVQVESIGPSLLYTWQGENASLAPILLTAHFDVVAIDPSTASHWSHPPFSGAVADGYIWGRGTMDDKAAVVAMLYAVERLIAQGYRPQRTVIMAFGHDEETGGEAGAGRIAELLQARGVEPLFLLDEGMPIADGILAGLTRPAAMIGVAQKGYANIELVVEGAGGHSSSPPPHTAVGILSRAIVRLEEHPMEARLASPVSDTFAALAPEMDLPRKTILTNRWLFDDLLVWQLAKKESTNAMIRTTMAATMFEGSPQENVLPSRAAARINVRMLPGDDIEDVLDHVTQVVADPRVKAKAVGDYSNPSPISDPNHPTFGFIATTVSELLPDTLVAPALLIATTDTRHYARLTPNIYRFRPLRVAAEDVQRFHGIDERVRITDLETMAKFYYRLIQNVQDPIG